PSLATAMAVGNQAAGTAPVTFQRRSCSFNTAMALFPAQATYSVLPSGANAWPIGWLPIAASGYVGTFTSVRSSVLVSSSETESEWLLATASVRSSGLRVNCEGARPTGASTTASVSASTRLSVPETEEPVTGSVTTFEPL